MALGDWWRAASVQLATVIMGNLQYPWDNNTAVIQPPDSRTPTVRFRRWAIAQSPARGLVARGGVEPPTFRFSVGRSYQLSYLAVMALGGPDGT